MELNNGLMLPNLTNCTDPESEPTAGPAGDAMRLAGNSMGNAVAALELNVYNVMAQM